jgi:Family of unknown function (DUF6069)
MRTLTTAAGAAAAAAAVWLVARAAGAEPTVTMGDQPPMAIALPTVISVALAASLAAWITVYALRRLTRRARALWPAVALVTLAVSFLPVLFARADGATRVALAAMHVAVAAVLIPGLLPHRRGPEGSLS